MFIHKEIIFVISFVFLLSGLILILFILDFIKLKKNISQQKKRLVNNHFFFHAYEPIVYSLNQTNSAAQKEINKKEISVKFFQNFFFNFPDPLIILDSHFNITELNRQGQALIEENAVGRNIILAMRMSGLEELLKKLLLSKKFETGQLRTLGSPEQFFHAWASFFKRGKDNQILLRLYNSTNEKKFQSLQRDFLANASHELRTPITAILGCCETLLGVGKSDEKIRTKFMKIIKKESSRMRSLVEDLLLLLNIERVEHSYPSGNISINDLFIDLMQLVPKIYSVRNKLTFFKPLMKIDIPGDYNEIKQVMLNIIDNAVKYGSSKKAIEIRCRKKDSFIELVVIDFGKGIETNNIPLLTNRFFRVDESRSREMGSTGLGLSIVKHIISRHNGNLEIKSHPGAGSAFKVCLPLQKKINVEDYKTNVN
tara:strand:- start:586 stop:1863 length:1278 start_codon:yes stop_codon:yes gene_type:complete